VPSYSDIKFRGKLMSYAIGVDIGGTKIAAGVVDARGQVVEKLRVETPVAVHETVQAIIELIRQFDTRYEVEAVGLGAPGFVDHTTGVLHIAPNTEWRNVPLAQLVGRAVDVATFLENDANAAAWGEYIAGAARGISDVMLVTVGTGVGGGIVSEHRLVRGGFGYAAEVGHLKVKSNGRQCGCGQRGCWETYASGSTLTRQAQDLVRKGRPGMLTDLAEGDPKRVTGPLIEQAIRAGDSDAAKLLMSLASWLGLGMASISAVLDPKLFVLGGGLSSLGDVLLPHIRVAYSANLSAAYRRPHADIKIAELGNDAGIVGAASLGRLRVGVEQPIDV
jgi:glucokinase